MNTREIYEFNEFIDREGLVLHVTACDRMRVSLEREDGERFTVLRSEFPEHWAPYNPEGIFSRRPTPESLDPVDFEAGLKMLASIGYDEPETVMVITYALQRWARGEEAAGEKGAINVSFHGIPMTQWRMVLAAALSAGRAAKVMS